MTKNSRKRKRPLWWIILALAALGLIGAWIWGKPRLDEKVGEQYELRIAIINRFLSSSLQQYWREHGQLPDGATALEYWPAKSFLGDEFLPDDFLIDNMAWLPGSEFSDDGGVISARLWLDHFSLSASAEMPSPGFAYESSRGGRLSLPVLWYFYEHPTTGKRVAVADAEGRATNLSQSEFTAYLEAAFAFAEEQGIPFTPQQLSYARRFE